MEQQTFGNKYDSNATFQFFRRWWKLLLIVFIVASALSVVASLLVTPRYKSTAILFPTNSNRLSKAITDHHYSLDFMDYGIERDCEYAIQILLSQSMEDDVCNKFNLLEHYGISANDPQKKFKLHENYRSNVSVKRTEYLGVEVSVLDIDPDWAADIANFIAGNYDTLCHRIHHDRASDAANIMQGVCEQMESDLYALEDSLKRHPEHRMVIEQLISDKSKELATMQTRAAQTHVDVQENVSYKFWLDQASSADKKAYPKRAVIVLLGAFGTLAMCILVLLIMENFGKKEESTKPQSEN